MAGVVELAQQQSAQSLEEEEPKRAGFHKDCMHFEAVGVLDRPCPPVEVEGFGIPEAIGPLGLSR